MMNNSTKRSRSFTMIFFLTGLFVLAAAAVIVLAYTNTAMTQGMIPGEKNVLTGEIVAIDNGHQVKALTLRSADIGTYPDNAVNVFVTKNTEVKICDMREPARDIAVSRDATVTYHEVRGWMAVATSISERC